MTVTRYNWCDRCDDRVELVPMAGESADGSGGVRPVPPGVASEPEVRDE